jgi:glycosyltransferase involved in cell wall biosynthesis
MLKKVLIKGPILSRSGYGEQSRFALRSLRSRPDLFDIYIVNIAWGGTGQITNIDEETDFINECLIKTQVHVQQKGQFDISVQVTVPNEFEKIAPVNIGYTAGIETTKVAPQWIQKSNDNVDKLIVVSNHSKKVFEQTTYDVKDQNGNEIKGWGLQVPVEAVNYPVREFEPEEVNIDFKTDKNFLVVSQWGPRKNLENTVKWFVETFRDEEDVGLVLKTNTASDSVMDREITQKRLESLLKAFGERKCSVYLIHGEVSPGNLAWLYEHPTMKALINIGHGEGYGLPLFEAAYHGLPLITTAWSGQMDFICKPNKKGKQVPRIVRVDYDVNEVQKSAVWNGVIQADSKWAFARENSYKRALTECLEKETHYRNEAEGLKNYIRENFTDEIMYHQFSELVYGEELVVVDVQDLPKISIITSVYDGDDFIRPFLEDITSQTIFEDKCELILINANSPGNEEEVIQEYLDKYPNNIVYKHLEEDPGIYGVWNMGVEMATGEYLTNANLDDRKAINSLERHAVELFANDDVDLVYADMLLTENPNETFDSNTSQGRRYNFAKFSVENLKMSNMPHASPMWRKSYHDKYGLFDTSYQSAGDWEMWLRGATQGSKFKKINTLLGLYYFNPKGISTNPENFSWKREEEMKVFKKYKDNG